jgi:uncharacterized membrane protein
MPSSAVKERLGSDIALWQADGLISAGTCRLLRDRYQEPGFGLTSVVRHLSTAGGLLAAFGLLGLIGLLMRSGVLLALFAAPLSAGLLWAGLRLSADHRGRYQHSSKVVLALGVIACAGAAGVLAQACGADEGATILWSGLLVMPVTLVLAYRFQNIFLLVLGLIGFFHWVGSWNRMWGRSTYVFSVEDPRLMAGVALAVIGVGVLHEQLWRERTRRFYLAYQTLGLIYLNLSLLILSIYPRSGEFTYTALLTAAGLAQVVAGARLKNGLFLGMGVTTLAVDLFTRFHEQFWDQLDKGLYFLLGGGILFGFGAGFELLARRRGRGAAS